MTRVADDSAGDNNVSVIVSCQAEGAIVLYLLPKLSGERIGRTGPQTLARVADDSAGDNNVSVIVSCQAEGAIVLYLLPKLGGNGVGQTGLQSLIGKRHDLNGFVACGETIGRPQTVTCTTKEEGNKGEQEDVSHGNDFSEASQRKEQAINLRLAISVLLCLVSWAARRVSSILRWASLALLRSVLPFQLCAL